MRRRVCNVSTVRASSETNEVSLDLIWHNQPIKPILMSSVNLFSNKLWRGNSVWILERNKHRFFRNEALCYIMSKCPHAHRIDWFRVVPGAAYSILQGWSQDDDVTVELLRRRRWLLLEPPPMETNKASQDSLKPESQDSPGILADEDADNSSQIMVPFKL